MTGTSLMSLASLRLVKGSNFLKFKNLGQCRFWANQIDTCDAVFRHGHRHLTLYLFVLGKEDYMSLHTSAKFSCNSRLISETLRKYPPLPWLIRETIEDYPIPHTDKVIEKGTRVIIPTWSIQHDWRYYPNPEHYDPERFYGDNANNIRAGTYMPFGDGPRYCIGEREIDSGFW